MYYIKNNKTEEFLLVDQNISVDSIYWIADYLTATGFYTKAHLSEFLRLSNEIYKYDFKIIIFIEQEYNIEDL